MVTVFMMSTLRISGRRGIGRWMEFGNQSLGGPAQPGCQPGAKDGLQSPSLPPLAVIQLIRFKGSLAPAPGYRSAAGWHAWCSFTLPGCLAGSSQCVPRLQSIGMVRTQNSLGVGHGLL